MALGHEEELAWWPVPPVLGAVLRREGFVLIMSRGGRAAAGRDVSRGPCGPEPGGSCPSQVCSFEVARVEDETH